jgi:murein DD-endopeptidase MepM/ murein hydrolase activator NlpD
MLIRTLAATLRASPSRPRLGALVVLAALLPLGLVAAPRAAAVPPAAPPAMPPDLPPSDGPVLVRPFDPPARPWLPGHRGIDLLGRPDAVVRAAADGVVLLAGSVAGKPVVVVGHGAARTTYEPVAAEVGVGQRVARGQPVGRLVAAGSHCAPAACLHLGLIRRHTQPTAAGAAPTDTYLDPMLLLQPEVRLLPLPGPAVRPR